MRTSRLPCASCSPHPLATRLSLSRPAAPSIQALEFNNSVLAVYVRPAESYLQGGGPTQTWRVTAEPLGGGSSITVAGQGGDYYNSTSDDFAPVRSTGPAANLVADCGLAVRP